MGVVRRPLPTVFARRGHLGNDYQGRLHDRLAPQCDAAEFLQGVLDRIHEDEETRVEVLHLLPSLGVRGAPAVLREHVHGCLIRERIRCSRCEAVSDHLRRHDIVLLDIGLRGDRGAVSLNHLWERHWR